MAKVKTPKPKKASKISNNQLQRLQAVVKGLNSRNVQIGSLESQKHELLHQTVYYSATLKDLQEELEKDYGTVNIDINDGTIKYD